MFHLLIEVILETLRNHQPKSWLYYNLGTCYQFIDKKMEALESIEEAIRLDPKDKECYKLKVLILDQLGRREEQFECYDNILECEPSNEIAHYNKGTLYEDLG